MFDIGRPSHLDGLACGLVTLGDLLLEDIANQDVLVHTLRSLIFFPGLSRHLGVAGIAASSIMSCLLCCRLSTPLLVIYILHASPVTRICPS